MELKKEDSKMLQGLSVLAMVWLHLFNKEYQGLFIPNVFLGGIPLSFYISQLSDFCVFGFAFCSGYAHMFLAKEDNYYRKRLKGVWSLLCNYWLILIIFCIISILIGQADFMPGSIGKFLANALTLDNSYNGAWWYMFTYIVLVLISPVVLKLVDKLHPIGVMIIGFLIYCCAYYVRFYFETGNWFLTKFGPFGMTFFEYLIGAVCYKTRMITKIYSIWKKIPTLLRGIVAGVLVVGMLYGHTKIIPSLFIAPVTGSVVMLLFHFWKKPNLVQRFFLMIGKHSTNIWVIHMFFYANIFKGFVYIAKYPVLIYGLMLGVTLMASVLLMQINCLTKKLSSCICRK